MFGVGMQEVALILVIALLVVGPKRIPDVARALGKAYAEFRRTFDQMKHSVEMEIRSAENAGSPFPLAPPPAGSADAGSPPVARSDPYQPGAAGDTPGAQAGGSAGVPPEPPAPEGGGSGAHVERA